MSLRVVLNQQERDWLLEFHTRNAESIQAKIGDLQKKLAESQSRIIELTGKNLDGPEILPAGGLFPEYEPMWALWKKAEYFLAQEGHLLNTREIAERIVKTEHPEPGFENNFEP